MKTTNKKSKKAGRSVLGSKQVVYLKNGKYATWSLGSGPLIVLLHGWPVTSYHWRHLVPALNSRGFQSLCIDLKGLGESVANDKEFKKEKIAREILEVISSLHPATNHFAVIGHDWGGSIALAMAVLEPNKVSSLIVEDEVAPGIEVPLEGESCIHYPGWHGGFHRSVGLAEDLIRDNEERYINFFLNLRYKNFLSSKDRKHYLAHYRHPKKTGVALAYYRSYQNDSQFFRFLEKKKLEMSILGVAGVFGMGAAVCGSLNRIALRVSGVMMNLSGHYPAEEEPKKFNDTVIGFLLSNRKEK